MINRLKKMLIFNSVLRLLIEGYIELAICSMLNIISFTHKEDRSYL
jgi:hypothetical protein